MKYLSYFMVIMALALQACHEEDHEHHNEMEFVVTSPLRTDTSIYQEYVAQIKSIQHIELRALEKGYLQKIYIDEGQLVKKGQLLFQIMPVIYEAEAEKAKAEVSFAQIEYNNTKALADSQIVSKNELALAKARLDKAKAEYSLALAHLSFTEIRAPFDGIIGRFNDVRLGSLLDEGELLTTLSDNGAMWVYFNVPEAEYLDFASKPKDQNPRKVKLQLANNKLFSNEGIIETIEADFNNETGNIAFRAKFLNPDRILRNGETGNILMPVDLDNTLLIPQEATYEVLGEKFVFVVDKNGVVEARQIEIGSEIPHLYTVTKGLKESDQIIVEGIRKVKNGQKVKTRFVPQKEIINQLNHLHAE